MAVLTSKALHEQLSVIMGALTKAAVAEICEVVDEGYAVLQMEITRSHKENEDLKKKLHLIESIVVRGSGAGKATVTEVAPAADGAQQTETPQQQQQRDSDEGAAAPGGDGGAAVVLRQELPDVVLIKDEDSDSNDTFEEDNKTPADGGTAAAREGATSSPISRSVKRHWPGSEDTERKTSEQLTLKTSKVSAGTQKKSVSVYTLDSPRSEPGCSGQLGGDEMEAGESVCSYSSQMDPDVQLVHQECSLVPPSVMPAGQVSLSRASNPETLRCGDNLSSDSHVQPTICRFELICSAGDFTDDFLPCYISGRSHRCEWPCDGLATCPGCTPPFAQLGLAPPPRDPVRRISG